MNRMVRTMVVFALSCSFVLSAVTIAQQTNPGSDKTASPGLWTLKADMPAEKVNHGAAVVSGKIYVFGGSNTLGASNETYVYDIATDSWTTAPASATLQTARISPMVEAVNGKVYVIGGYSQLAAPMRISSTVLEFDPATSLMATKSAMPTPVAGAGSFVMNGKIFILGGCGTGGWNTDMKDSIQIYDPAANTWSVSSSTLPALIRSFGATALGDQVVIAGGWTKGNPTMIKGTWVGKVAGDAITWTAAPDYPTGELNRLSAGSSDAKIYFSGGQLMTGSATTPKTYSYNLSTNAWEALQDNPNPVHSSCSMLYDGTGSMLLIGGRSSTAPALADVSAMLTVTKPNMEVTTTSLKWKLLVDGSKRLAIQVSNTGSARLSWNAAVEPTSAQWLTILQASGDIEPDASMGVPIRLLAKGLSPGTYQASVRINSNDASNPTKMVPVTLTVQAEPFTEKRIMIEEFTGTWCGWCPYGVDSLHAIAARYPDNVSIVSYHQGDPMQVFPDVVLSNFFKVDRYPGALVDRRKFPDEDSVLVMRDTWGKQVDNILTATPTSPISIFVSNKAYNPATKAVRMKVNVIFNADMNETLKMVVVQTESGLNYTQKLFGNPNKTEIKPYFHEHVIRQAIPDYFGENLSSGPRNKGETLTMDVDFTSIDSVVDNSELVVMIVKPSSYLMGEVVQSYVEDFVAGIPLDVPQTSAPASYALRQNYPNPFSAGAFGKSVTSITYSVPRASAVRLAVYDMLGRLVTTLVNEISEAGTFTVQWNARNLAAGVYLCKLEAGAVILTRSMTITK